VGNCAAHAGAAEDDQAQGLVYDVREHGAQCEGGQICAAQKPGGGQCEADMGEEEHLLGMVFWV